jgi:hypothetical protein
MTNELEKNGHELFAKLIGEKDALAIHEHLKKYDPDFARFLNENQTIQSVQCRPSRLASPTRFSTSTHLSYMNQLLGRFRPMRRPLSTAD